MKHRNVYGFVVLTMIALLVFAGCEADNGGNGAAEDNPGTVRIGMNNWAENIAVSNMWKILLEEEGYEVELVDVDKAVLYSGIAEGDLDIGMEVWLPATDAPFVDEYGDRFDIQDTWYEGTQLGLVVPEYMDIESMDELNDYASDFSNEIIGIDPGSSINGLTEDAVDIYDLDFDFIEGSEPGMLSTLDSAYENEDPVVVTLWSPHWAFAEYDLKYLNDPEGIYGEGDDIYFITREGFEDDFAPVLETINASFFDDQSLGELMAIIEELDDPVEGAQTWIDDNRELVDGWLAL